LLKSALPILYATLLLGCVPYKFSGYAPQGPGQLESRRGCFPPGINDALRISTEGGVDIVVWAGPDTRRQTIDLTVDLTVPADVAVRFASADLIFDSPAWPQPRLLPVAHITTVGPREFSPTAILHGADDDAIGPFSLWFRSERGTSFMYTDIPTVDRFTLELPPLIINGHMYRIAPISFEPFKEWSLAISCP
jgi:hypothetical protein